MTSSSSSTNCCFSLFGHLPSRQSKIAWVGDNTTSIQCKDDDETIVTATTITNRRDDAYIDEGTTDGEYSNSTSTTIIDSRAAGSVSTTVNDTVHSTPNDDVTKKYMVLMEIVGAMGLETKHRKKVDPYCIVRVCDDYDNNNDETTTKNDDNPQKFRTVHRTDTIYNDGNPIWTVQTKSLCIIEITSSTIHVNNINHEDGRKSTGAVVIDVYHGNSQLDGFTTPLVDFVTATTTATSAPATFLKDVTNQIIPSQLQLPSLPQVMQQKLGRVTIPFDEIVHCCRVNDCYNENAGANRTEYVIRNVAAVPQQQQQQQKLMENSTIALRFRFTKERDVSFLTKLSQSHTAVRDTSSSNVTLSKNNSSMLSNISNALLWQANGTDDAANNAADINFRCVKKKSLTMSYKKIDKDGIELVRVQPYPDPTRIDTTTWMSAMEMERVSYEPSTKWIHVGRGTLGIVHCEIIGCNDLPQMDSTDFTSTDPVVTMTLEDNFVRSDVIWDQLHPRWMPWTTRAYQFHIRHPASILCISVLDYDEGVFDGHDPVGRVVIQPSSFKPNITNTLHYVLQDDPSEEPTSEDVLISDDDDDENVHNLNALPSSKQQRRGNVNTKKTSRGTIIIRLRIEWTDESLAMKMFYTTPPRFIINVDNEKSYEALTYTTRGVGYMHNVSIKSVKLLAHEVIGYGSRFCFTMDVLMEILLWRGRYYITKSISIWFPIHSIALFIGAVTLVERPDWVVPICLYGISWILLSVNYHVSNHPNPWLRVPPYMQTISMTILGRRTLLLTSSNDDGLASIAVDEGRTDAMRQEKLDELKAARMSALLSSTISFLLKVYYIYSKTSDRAIKITTDRTNKWNILSSKLKYIHMLLLYMCQYLRLGRNFSSWKSNYTAAVTSYCLVFATCWCIFPMSLLVHWLVRILIYALLGPWMKLVDVRCVHRWYATEDELLARIDVGKYTAQDSDIPDFDNLLKNKTVSSMIHLGRVKAEELYKLRDMRQLLFGQFSELIPFVDNSRYPSIPLPQSTATVTTGLHGVEENVEHYVPGQLLSGNMIHAADGSSA